MNEAASSCPVLRRIEMCGMNATYTVLPKRVNHYESYRVWLANLGVSESTTLMEHVCTCE
jgi:hypothetical protein